MADLLMLPQLEASDASASDSQSAVLVRLFWQNEDGVIRIFTGKPVLRCESGKLKHI
jgi:hypothetical protein